MSEKVLLNTQEVKMATSMINIGKANLTISSDYAGMRRLGVSSPINEIVLSGDDFYISVYCGEITTAVSEKTGRLIFACAFGDRQRLIVVVRKSVKKKMSYTEKEMILKKLPPIKTYLSESNVL